MSKSITVLHGRFVADPQMNQTNGTTVARFTLAVDRDFKKEGQPEADFIRCVAFNKLAEHIGKYFVKGKEALVEGRLQTGEYEKDGVKHYTTDLLINGIDFCGSKSDSNNSAAEQKPIPTEDFVNVPEGLEEELPFA